MSVANAGADPEDGGVDPDPERLRADGDARLEFLVGRGFLAVTDEGELTPTESFEDVRAVYADSYTDVDDETFHDTVAEVFDIPRTEAPERVAQLGLSRWELATYLAVQSDLETDLPGDVVLELAAVMAAAGEASAVPPKLRTLPTSFEDVLADERAAVVFVFARECDPCRSMKAELDDTLGRLPEAVTAAGADGGDAPGLRRAFEVDVAPTTLVFVDGELAEKLEGYTTPEDIEETVRGALDA